MDITIIIERSKLQASQMRLAFAKALNNDSNYSLSFDLILKIGSALTPEVLMTGDIRREWLDWKEIYAPSAPDPNICFTESNKYGGSFTFNLDNIEIGNKFYITSVGGNYVGVAPHLLYYGICEINVIRIKKSDESFTITVKFKNFTDLRLLEEGRVLRRADRPRSSTELGTLNEIVLQYVPPAPENKEDLPVTWSSRYISNPTKLIDIEEITV